MTICEFCLHFQEGVCGVGLNIPKSMRCRQFSPGIEKFCAEPADFVSPNQIVEMARYFGIDKAELKRVRTIAEKAILEAQQHEIV